MKILGDYATITKFDDEEWEEISKLVDRYNTEVDETLFDSVISATSFLDDDYMAAILRKADAAQRG